MLRPSLTAQPAFRPPGHSTATWQACWESCWAPPPRLRPS